MAVESFADLLAKHRRRGGWSRNRLAHEVGVDASYLTRIEHDERNPPRAHIVDALARTLQLDPAQWDELRTMGGYSPRSINGSGWPKSVSLLLLALNDYTLSDEERTRLDDVVSAIVERWRC